VLRRLACIATATCGVLVPATASAQDEPAPPAVDGTPREWLVPIPTGCDVPPLPDVVFLGSLGA